MKAFLQDESGAVTIDWVALTAGGLLTGTMLVYGIFNGGVAPLVDVMNTQLATVSVLSEPGPAPELNPLQP
ncbi:MAG: pilus assembly protein [Pseudomonadota bacterium]